MAILIDGAKRGRPGTIILDYRDGRGKRRVRQFSQTVEGRKQAKAALGDALRRSARGEPAIDTKTTVGDVAETWLRVIRPSVSQGTVRCYECILNRRILPEWGRVPVSRITRGDIRAWLAEQLDQYVPGSVGQSLAVLRLILRQAVDDGRIAASPAAGISRAMHLGWRSDKIRALTEEQAAKLLATCDLHTRTLLFTGLRLGESLGLQGRDVSGTVLRVERQRLIDGSVAPLKTATSRREVDLPVSLAGELARLAAPEAFLFPISRDEFYTRFRHAVTRAGLDHVTPHCLRHTFATIHLSHGADLEWLRRQLGHSSPTLTVTTYGRSARPKPRGAPEAYVLAIQTACPEEQKPLPFDS